MTRFVNANDMFQFLRMFKHEVGGYYKRDQFFQTTNSQTNHNGRQFVILPIDIKRHVWHFHPREYGMWPSFEDLTLQTTHNVKSLIFTDIGVWILNIVPKIQQNAHLMHITTHFWSEFHGFMIQSHRQLTDNAMIKIFKTFAKAMQEHGYNLDFVTKREYEPTKLF